MKNNSPLTSEYAACVSLLMSFSVPFLATAGDKSLPVGDATAREGPYWSLMFEVSENKTYKPVNLETIVEVRCCDCCVLFLLY